MLTYIDVSAAFVGVDPSLSFYFVSIANAASAIGRVSAGLLADRFGALNVMIPATVVAGALTYVWPFVTSKGGYIGIAISYGCVRAASIYDSWTRTDGFLHLVSRRACLCPCSRRR